MRLAPHVLYVSVEGRPVMSQDAETTEKQYLSPMMEHFGRFSSVETLETDTNITDQSFDESSDEEYGEEVAGA